MCAFLRGWKRKVGVVTLMIALVFMTGWVRSLFGRDYISRFSAPETYIGVYSERELLAFKSHVRHRLPPRPDHPYLDWGSEPIHSQLLLQLDLTWYFRCLGFGFGEDTFNTAFGRRFLIWIVPYWAIVVPLALISCWLLLSKPCKSNRKQIAEPIPDDCK